MPAQRQPFCLLLIDLDHFKQINDSYGHASGDEALRYAAHCVRTTLRDFDVFGRLGGEEFAVVLSGVEYEAIRFVTCARPSRPER